MKLKCGPNGKKFSGLEMEVETPGISIAKLPNIDSVTTLKEFITERADGALIREVWWLQWWNFIKGYSPPQTQPVLMTALFFAGHKIMTARSYWRY